MNALKKISFVNLYTPNFEKMINFYTKIGLKPLQKNKGNWFGFSTGQTTFALEPQKNRKSYNFEFNKENPILIQFEVKSIKNLKEITKKLENQKVRIKQKTLKKSYGTITTFLDPNNNVIELLVKNN